MDTDMKMMAGLVAACVLAIVAVIASVAMSPKLELIEKDWTCTKHHSRTTMIMVGKNMVPNVSKVCDRYERKI